MTESRFQLTAVYEVVENGWTQATIAELPGVVTAAPTKQEATDLLHDALREYILALPAMADPGQPESVAPGERDVLEIAVST